MFYELTTSYSLFSYIYNYMLTITLKKNDIKARADKKSVQIRKKENVTEE